MSCSALQVPLKTEQVLALKLGQAVRLSGIVVTARDRAHSYLIDRPESDALPFQLTDGAVYHCGPLIRLDDSVSEVVSAGPTTSARMNSYTPRLIERYRPRAIIGKGGMDDAVLNALERFGAVYLSAVGGAGGVMARSVVEVIGHHKLSEFGSPEAMWMLRVKDFPTVVTMDAHGNSLHAQVRQNSERALGKLLNIL